MKARSFLPLAVLAVLGAASTSSFAEGKTYKVVMRERHKAGDVVTKTDKKVDSQHVLVKGPDGSVVNDRNTVVTVTEHTIKKAIEVDEQGQVTKGVVYFVNWSLESNDASKGKDTSLTGLHVAYEGRGKLRNWKVLTPGKMPADQGREYLDKEYGNKEEDHGDFGAVIEPKKEVEIGESWNPDVAEIVKALGNQFKVDVAKSTAKVTLTGVEGMMGEFVVDVALQTVSVGSPAGELVWKEGGLMTMKKEGKHSLVENDPSGDSKMVYELKGTGGTQGVNVTLDVRGTKESGSKQGGEMPAVPGAPPETK